MPTISPSSPVTENTVLTLSCEVDSHPVCRLRLHRQGTPAAVEEVNANILHYKVVVGKDDNGALFYCRADDNNKYPGWKFDVESDQIRINVLCKLLIFDHISSKKVLSFLHEHSCFYF